MANLQMIKELARKRNFPLEQLAKELDITPQALSKMMRENSTKVTTLERIAQLLKVSVKVFFPEEDSCPVSDHSVSLSGKNLTNQTTYGDNSPAVRGNNNHFGACASIEKAFASIDKTLDEVAAQRKLVEQALAQNATLISILQSKL